MDMRKSLIAGTAMLLMLGGATGGSSGGPGGDSLGLSGLAKLGEVDPRFQSYNVEMVDVTGGRFGAPYGGPAGEIHRMRPPLDLSAARQMAAGIRIKRKGCSTLPAQQAAASMARNCSTNRQCRPSAVFPRAIMPQTLPAIAAFSAIGRALLHRT